MTATLPCPECTRPMTDDDLFCPDCGTRQEGAAEAEAPEPEPKPAVTPEVAAVAPEVTAEPAVAPAVAAGPDMATAGTTDTPGVWKRARTWRRGHPTIVLCAGVVIALLLGLALGAGDRAAARRESRSTLAAARRHASAIVADAKARAATSDEAAKTRAEATAQDAVARRDAAQAEADTLKSTIASLSAKRVTLAGSVSTKQATLRKLDSQINGAEHTIAMGTVEGTGTYVVGADIRPGTYRAAATPGCYWARLSSLTTSDIIDNDNADGPVVIQVLASDKALELNGCGQFHRVGG